MTVITYPSSSPYADTPQYNWRMGIFEGIDIPADATDIALVLPPKYNENPMLLSQDIYNTPTLWWVFSTRNINVLRDPIWDLQAGITIMVPTIKRLNTLGITV